MKPAEAKEKFKEAGRLYRERDYQSSLDLLDKVDHVFPNDKNITYARAMCLSQLTRFYEAKLLARRLERELEDPRSEELKTKITRRERRSKLKRRNAEEIEVNDDWGF